MAQTEKRENLADWLNYIERLHSAEIEFGLSRIGWVFAQLFPTGLTCRVITVGGTNGKGSTCTLIENLLIGAGYRCGKSTSPHINIFNERIALDGRLATDEEIINAFQCIEQARENTLLTYFEYTFLAALVLFQKHSVDFAICEVGLGGRLDAVNILSPDVSVVTNIGLDHTQWLGATRELIAMEKVAISRPHRLCVIGDKDFPENARAYLLEHQVNSLIATEDYEIVQGSEHWQLQVNTAGQQFLSVNSGLLEQLPLLETDHHYQNASCAILAVLGLSDVKLRLELVREALLISALPGRCQVLSDAPLIVVDVAHNVDSVKALSRFVDSKIAHLPSRPKTIAVFSMLDDKDIEASLEQISAKIDEWYIAPLSNNRAASIEKIQRAIQTVQTNPRLKHFDSVRSAFACAKQSSKSDDCVLVFGSFFVVGDILHHQL